MYFIDFTIIIIYMLTMLAIGYFLGKDNSSQDDYFLAGRSMPWLPVSLSVAATMISANSFIGGPGWAYLDGLGPFMVNITVPLAIVFALYTTIPMFYNLKLTSIYEYAEKRLGVYNRTITVLGFLLNSLIQVSSMVYIPALIISKFTTFDIKISVIIIVSIAIIYTLLGGIKAVIWTDAIQMIVLWGSLLGAFIYIFSTNDFSFWESYHTALTHNKLKAIDFSFNLTSTNSFWASLFGGFIMWYRYFALDQVQVQRLLTSKSYKGIKISFLFSSIFMNILYFLFLILGILLFSLYNGRHFESANDIMITFIRDDIPIGFTGLLLSGVFAAAMSSIDSLLNSMTTVYTKDIHERFFSKSENSTSLKNTMTISAIFGILIIGFSIIGFSGSLKSILDTIGNYISYISGPMCGAFILAMFTLKANDKGVALGVILGMFFTYLLNNIFTYSWIWNPLVGFLITALLGYLFSFLFVSSKSSDEVFKYTIIGQRKLMIKNNSTTEDGENILPLSFDKYSFTLILFFILQYIFLVLIN